jgi:hypothetical protein
VLDAELVIIQVTFELSYYLLLEANLLYECLNSYGCRQ